MDSKKKQIVEKYKSEEKMLISDLRTITELLRALTDVLGTENRLMRVFGKTLLRRRMK